MIFASKRNGTVLRNSFGYILCCEKLYTKGYHCKFMWRKWRKSSLTLSSMSLVVRIPPNSLITEARSSFCLGNCIDADSAVMTHVKEVKFMSVSWTHRIKKPQIVNLGHISHKTPEEVKSIRCRTMVFSERENSVSFQSNTGSYNGYSLLPTCHAPNCLVNSFL